MKHKDLGWYDMWLLGPKRVRELREMAASKLVEQVLSDPELKQQYLDAQEEADASVD